MKGYGIMGQGIKEIFTKNDSSNLVVRLFKEWAIPILIAFILYLIITNFIAFKAYIPSESMEPTMYKGDHLLVTKVYNTDKIKRGDILVFESKELNDVLIKRVIGLPGDVVDIKDGIISINGQVIHEDYIKEQDNHNGKYIVPEGKFFFRGDNRNNSKDSSQWKNPYVDAEDIMGKAQMTIYPFEKFGSLYEEE